MTYINDTPQRSVVQFTHRLSGGHAPQWRLYFVVGEETERKRRGVFLEERRVLNEENYWRKEELDTIMDEMDGQKEEKERQTKLDDGKEEWQ